MRVISFLVLALFFISPLKAQDFIFLDEASFEDSTSILKLSLSREASSNALTFGLINNFLFADGFELENKEAFINADQERFNLKNQNAFGVSQLLGNGTTQHAFSLSYQAEWYASASKKLAEMALFGNAHLAGMSINSKNTELLNISSLSLSYERRMNLNKSWEIGWRVGLDFYEDLQQYRADEVFFLTEEQGSYIDFSSSDLRFYSSSDYWDGIGLHLGMSFKYKKEKSEFSFSTGKIRLAFLNQEKQYQIDTSFRFEGLELSGADLLNGNITELTDSLIDQFLYSNVNEKSWQILPVPVYLGYMHTLNPDHKIGAQLSAISLGQYGWELRLIDQIKLAPTFSLRSSLAYGDFTGISWLEEAEYVHQDKYHFYLGLAGIQGLFLKDQAGHYGLSAGFAVSL
ncbi:MAG: hypothetical protein JXR19_05530 [Bacteroidia bacterium]